MYRGVFQIYQCISKSTHKTKVANFSRYELLWCSDSIVSTKGLLPDQVITWTYVIASEVFCHSLEHNFTEYAHDIYPWYLF